MVHLRRNYKNYLISLLILYLLRILFYKDISVNIADKQVLNEKKESNEKKELYENPHRFRKLQLIKRLPSLLLTTFFFEVDN